MKLNGYLLRTLAVLLAAVAPVVILLRQPHQSADLAAAAPLDWPRLSAWACCLLGLLALFVLAGLRIRGRVLGVLIDERNRYSLSRLQMSLWTLLVLGTLYALYIANIVRGDAISALMVDLDYNLIALMGFSLASFVSAPMALSRKADLPADNSALASTGQQLLASQNLTAMPSAAGQVLTKSAPQDARLADLIRGEDVTNGTIVDLPRLQMLLITLLVVLVYGAAVGHSLGSGAWVLKELPQLHNTLLLLALISHGGYVVGKLIPSSITAPLAPPPVPDQQAPAPALQNPQ
ncbi:hypothetical protein J4P02_22705 [Pseudomonas sp. NFXW11]|uniref:hypothetical protein n=1 Tax=Pseudomonas sp. NFXW11 TaxID=2819531 RepID=UPI003CF9E562